MSLRHSFCKGSDEIGELKLTIAVLLNRKLEALNCEGLKRTNELRLKTDIFVMLLLKETPFKLDPISYPVDN
jgi:hypothetical protein